MSAKIKKTQRGPTWFEVGLGALLSIALGAALGAAYLVFKPVLKVKDIPKDAPSGAVYLIEGARDFNKTAEVNAKRSSFAAGESVEIEEGELNILLGGAGKPSAPAKPGDKDKPAPPQKTLDVGPLNARIHAGKIQFSDTASFNVFSVTGSVIVQASGEFKKHGSAYEFDPDVIYVGGCPVQNFMLVRGWIMKKLLFTQPVPDDIAGAWARLADVSIVGSRLRLKMP
jgi:hypothetical protein